MHFSLDFWNTIAQPNPEYSYQRNLLISNKLEVPYEKVAEIYTNSKQIFDGLALVSGMGFSTKGVYENFTFYCMEGLNFSKPDFFVTNRLRGLEAELQKLFLKYPPHISKELIEVLKECYKNHTFSITSNTNFISGKCIKKLIYNNELDRYFSFYLFSDEIGIAKPNPLMFEYVSTCYVNFCESTKREIERTVHIGDHPVCDAPKIFKHHIISNTSELPILIKELTK